MRSNYGLSVMNSHAKNHDDRLRNLTMWKKYNSDQNSRTMELALPGIDKVKM